MGNKSQSDCLRCQRQRLAFGNTLFQVTLHWVTDGLRGDSITAGLTALELRNEDGSSSERLCYALSSTGLGFFTVSTGKLQLLESLSGSPVPAH